MSRRPPRVPPGAGQESAWDYPRPPRIEPVRRVLKVEWAGRVLAETSRGLRVLETASPPTYYFPLEDVRTDLLEPSHRTTICEWKGAARHWNARDADRTTPDVAWGYPDPRAGYEALAGRLAFYPRRVDACWVGSERVVAQPGEYYGGWITSLVTGPFKGAPGTEHW